MPSLINDGFPFHSSASSALGLSKTEFRRAREGNRLRPVFKHVYVDAAVPDSRWLRVQAVRLVAPSYAVICDGFASWLHGVATFRPSERHSLTPTLLVPHSTTRVTIPGVRCRQAIVPVEDITELDGVLVTTPVRTTSDLLRKLWRPYALAAADAMAHHGLVKPDEVIDFVEGLPGFAGIVQARALAQLIEPLTESRGESWQRLRVLDAGFPRPVAQFAVESPAGSRRYLDLAYPELLIGMEYDGAEHHSTEEDRLHDLRRRTELATIWGWRFVVSRKADILGDDPAFEHRLGELLGVTPRVPRLW